MKIILNYPWEFIELKYNLGDPVLIDYWRTISSHLSNNMRECPKWIFN